MFDFKAAFTANTVKKVILDTDTHNEIDDQYAVAYAIRSNDKMELLGICAAPFTHYGSDPAVGMEESYEEIHKIMALTDKSCQIPVFLGARRYLSDTKEAVPSPATDFIIKTARESEEKIFVVAIAAITNVASALMLAPDIKEKIAVVWLGGHVLHRWDTKEYNMWEDLEAARYVFDSGVDLLQVPCMGGGADVLATSVPELTHYVKGKNQLCDYLFEITAKYNRRNEEWWSKVIWDISTVALFNVPEAFRLVTMPRPIVTADAYYTTDNTRPLYCYVENMSRDPIFRDMFAKLSK